MGIRRLNPILASVMIAALFVAGCGGNREQQGTAFTEFLQTRVLDKPGVHVPKLSDEDRDRFGPFADDYAIITDFNKAMDESVSPKLKAAVSAGAIRSLGDVVTNRDKLQAAREGINAMGGALDKSVADADAARAKLDQPAELKAVYGKAYDRLVTQPAAAFKGIVPVMDTVLGQAIDLGKYIEEHKSSVRVSGAMIETSDPAVQSAINEKLQALQANQQAVQAAQQRMQAVVYGR